MKKVFCTTLLAGLLAACAQTPETFVVAPEVQVPSGNVGSGSRFALECVDLRPANYLIQIERKDEAAELRRSSTNVREQICTQLGQAWASQGFVIDPAADTRVEVAIKEMRVAVKQGSLKYNADSQVKLRVHVSEPGYQLSKPFGGAGSSQGSLKADQSVLEQDFNMLLGDVLTQIVINEELTNAVK